jgi:hypothetical protein
VGLIFDAWEVSGEQRAMDVAMSNDVDLAYAYRLQRLEQWSSAEDHLKLFWFRRPGLLVRAIQVCVGTGGGVILQLYLMFVTVYLIIVAWYMNNAFRDEMAAGTLHVRTVIGIYFFACTPLIVMPVMLVALLPVFVIVTCTGQLYRQECIDKVLRKIGAQDPNLDFSRMGRRSGHGEIPKAHLQK